ncbi:MAG: glutathione peroxidase [Candidatus Sericytochromatia bacterium]
MSPSLLRPATVWVACAALLALGLGNAPQSQSAPAAPAHCPSLLQHKLPDINGTARNLCSYSGKVVMVVNTASFCGFTPQYKELQTLYDRYRAKGLVILGFPANQFGKQEPNSNAEIAKFCEDNYKVSFPLFAKTEVLGNKANPLFRQLTARTGQAPLWNFHKYLIDREGKQVLSFSSSVSPTSAELQKQVERLLAAKP